MKKILLLSVVNTFQIFKRDTGRLNAFKITCDFDILVVLHSSIFVFSFASVYVFSLLLLADPIAEIKSGSSIEYKCILYNICNSKRGPSRHHKVVKSHHRLLQKRASFNNNDDHGGVSIRKKIINGSLIKKQSCKDWF